MTDQSRYARQISLPEIGQAGQDKLARASVLCVGAGGLGSPALLYLCAAGIGRIGLIDFDTVDKSNLQRQVLFDESAVGNSKAVEAEKRLKALNSDIVFDVYDAQLTDENAEDLFQDYDVVLDGTDNFETKYLINDVAVKTGTPWAYGAIQGFDGQAALFNVRGGACYRCLHPEPPKVRIANCAEAGVIGAVAGIIGMTQALQVIELIVGGQAFDPLIGALWVLDTKTMQSRRLDVPKNPACPVCSKKPEEIAVRFSSPVCGIIPEITAEQTSEKIQSDAEGIMLVDVREQEEWDAGHIEGALLWPLSRILKGEYPDLDQNAEIILHCQKGLRSQQAAQILKAQGYFEVSSMSGGYEAWQERVSSS